jgi:hypothetical protein
MTTTPDIATLRPSTSAGGAPGSGSGAAPGIPAAWRASVANHDHASALDALETYKKKDPSKGVLFVVRVRDAGVVHGVRRVR